MATPEVIVMDYFYNFTAQEKLAMTDNQDMCPICTEPFQKDEVLVRYLTWDKKHHSDKLGHLDCVLYLSQNENRKHPPTLEDQIDELDKRHSSATVNLAARITKLGG